MVLEVIQKNTGIRIALLSIQTLSNGRIIFGGRKGHEREGSPP